MGISIDRKRKGDQRMRIFGKARESLRIRKIGAARAVYVAPGNPEIQEIEIALVTEDGEKLTLRMGSLLAPQLIFQLQASYEAIAPPLNRTAGQWNSTQEGMQN